MIVITYFFYGRVFPLAGVASISQAGVVFLLHASSPQAGVVAGKCAKVQLSL